jgi:hypothetical protein
METAMFCPQCRCEYRPGFHQCANCEVPLVEELPPLPTPPPPTRWELDRRDSLNIAFVKGAFIGFACGELVAAIGYNLLFPQSTFATLTPASNNISWLPLEVIYPTLSMLPAIGILVGGFVSRNYRR